MTDIKITKIFRSGNSQAVRLPKEFRIEADRVYIKRVGDTLVLLPIDHPWQSMLDSLEQFSSDFLVDRQQPPVQERETSFS
ncbi:MAG: type II toxin-antitoxin system VapB family antitoxin [Ardenticatenaceae bacterium]|nr:type II toxin-antitoxin system VapB family antitoxin [Ardenticatenaceae bacterium]